MRCSGLSWTPGKGDPPRFGCIVLADSSALIAALRLLTTSISKSLFLLSFIRTLLAGRAGGFLPHAKEQTMARNRVFCR